MGSTKPSSKGATAAVVSNSVAITLNRQTAKDLLVALSSVLGAGGAKATKSSGGAKATAKKTGK